MTAFDKRMFRHDLLDRMQDPPLSQVEVTERWASLEFVEATRRAAADLLERPGTDKEAAPEAELAGAQDCRRNGDGNTVPSLLTESNGRVTDLGTVLAVTPPPIPPEDMVIFSRLMDALQGLDLGAPWGDQQRFVAWVRSGGRALSVAALFHPVTQRHAGWFSVVDEKWLRPPDYEGRDGLLLADAVFRVGLMLGSLPNAADKMAA